MAHVNSIRGQIPLNPRGALEHLSSLWPAITCTFIMSFSLSIFVWCLLWEPKLFKTGVINLSQCSSRVSPLQSVLFTDEMCYSQFSRAGRSNATANKLYTCGKDFEGNSDAHGLGIRIGVYLLWISSIIANPALPKARINFSQAHLVFSLAIIVANIHYEHPESVRLRHLNHDNAFDFVGRPIFGFFNGQS